MYFKPRFLAVFLCFFLFTGQALFAQQRVLTLEDAVLAYRKGLTPKRLKGFDWSPGGAFYSTLNDDGTEIIMHPIEKGYTEIHLKAAEIKPGLEKIPAVHWLSSSVFWFTQEDTLYEFSLENKRLKKILEFPSKEAQNLDYSSKARALAYTIKNNLYLAKGAQRKIPIEETADTNIVTGQAIARFEFGITKGTFWSPKGRFLAFYRKDESKVPVYPLVDISTTPASLKNIKYPMNGGKSEVASAWVYSLANGKAVRLRTKLDDHYLTNLSWSDDELHVFLAEVNRDQNHMQLNQYEPFLGIFSRTLFEESNPKWVEPEHPLFFTRFLANRAYWLSEKDGYMNLYEYNFRTKKLKQLTHNKWVIKNIVGYSQRANALIYTGTGPDPLNTHAYGYFFRDSTQVQLTKADGTHSVRLTGPNNEYLVDRFSSRSVPYEAGYVDLRTDQYNQIYRAPDPLENVVIGNTEIFTIKSYDGTDLYARLIKPSHFNPKKKYPVLVYVYNGPHVQLITNRWNTGAPLWMQWMAEQGYLIFTVDGHGSDNRGFAFESEIFRRLGTHEMQDQLIGVDWLKRQPYVNPDRIAVHGWSFGGFMTISLMLRHAGVFTTGVAGGPVTDWKWYEIMYGERYMDTEATNPEGFKEASVLNYVKKLKGRLMTIHGTVDDVVVPQHDYAFIKKCVDEGVQTDFYVYPGHPHNVRGKDRVHLMTKVLNYIMEHNQ